MIKDTVLSSEKIPVLFIFKYKRYYRDSYDYIYDIIAIMGN